MIELIVAFSQLLSALIIDTIDEALRADGKYYVVVACIVVIFIGFIAYLFNLESKVSKIEDQKNKK